MLTGCQKRVAILLPDLFGAGAERVMLNLASALGGKGVPVDVVVARATGPYAAETSRFARLVDLRSNGTLAGFPGLIRYLRKCRPATLLSCLHANIPAAWAKRVAGLHLRVVLSQHDVFTITPGQRATLARRIMPQLVKHFYPWADDIVAVSKGVAQGLARVSRLDLERIRVIYNPVITPDVERKSKEPLAHPWFVAGGPPVVLGVGSLCKRKDFAALIRAFAEVRKSIPARLLILGEGDERHNLAALVQELGLEHDVGLPGFVPNPYSFMARSSVFVLSSRSEGLPTVLVEAMYCGIPVVATDCPYGPREILADGRYGPLVPVGDVASLAQAIGKVLAATPVPLPSESWLPFEARVVLDQYTDVLLRD